MSDDTRQHMARMAAAASWGLGLSHRASIHCLIHPSSTFFIMKPNPYQRPVLLCAANVCAVVVEHMKMVTVFH